MIRFMINPLCNFFAVQEVHIDVSRGTMGFSNLFINDLFGPGSFNPDWLLWK